MIPDSAHVVLKSTPELAEALQTISDSRHDADTQAVPDPPHGADAETQDSPWITAKIEKDTILITATGKSRHSAFPEGSVNAIHELMRFLGGLTPLPEKDRELFRRLAYLSQEYHGEHTGIAGNDEVSGRTTCAATVLGLKEGQISLHFNIRYVITADRNALSASLAQAAAENNLTWILERDSAPNYFPKEHPAVQLLTDLYNEITDSSSESFVMGGGTYARKLPRAFAYGVGGMKESEEDLRIKKQLFLPGHGGAHEPDEGLNLRLLTEAMKIYAMAVVVLNECEL